MYTHFDPARPDPVTENITQFAEGIRENLAAIRDMVVGGMALGWSYAPAGGSAEQPETLTWAKGTERIRASLTWGVTGGEAGNVTAALFEYSADSGDTWDAIGTHSITYDSAGNVTGASWS
ncbi:hypothetical protein [Pseudazoarcus pumilus]|uniref:Uncharacterized protein n=1 Tax=Pseudazoarcus pumilus TaxID=2067960 RepID=A0A2I6S9E0_9RHOO|nr:hypothetical protein [Pseudazoarcus pumilus]AUN95868.1 hypothetical protein C0099_13570 [Pseudazoarcus pumilus]